MASGDLTTGTITYVDINDSVLIASTIDAINLAAATDVLYVIPLATQNKVMIFAVAREA